MTEEDDEPGHRLHPDTRYNDEGMHISAKGIDIQVDDGLLEVADMMESVEMLSVVFQRGFNSLFVDSELDHDLSVTVRIEHWEDDVTEPDDPHFITIEQLAELLEHEDPKDAYRQYLEQVEGNLDEYEGDD